MTEIWTHVPGDGPIVAVSVHAGHELRPDVAERMALPEADRLREEDPFTDRWTSVVPERVAATHSRFQVDLNRRRDEAVYLRPGDAWGLRVWKGELPDEVVQRSLAERDAFYGFLEGLLRRKEAEHGCFVVLDLHSYNHLRDGPAGPPAPPDENPMVNVGTGTMERSRWHLLVDRFIRELGELDFAGGRLDVRENVRFRGGNLPRWVHETFPRTGCALAIEVKKFFMDEWTGEPDWSTIQAIGRALSATIPGLVEELERK